MCELVVFTDDLKKQLSEFFEGCLPESGRKFEPFARHSSLTAVKESFERFWCLLHHNKIVGTVAIKKLSQNDCELKTMYLLKQYHGLGLGQKMLNEVFNYAKVKNYKRMYLDTMKTSEKAIKLYKNNGFIETEKYNDNDHADIFMFKKIF